MTVGQGFGFSGQRGLSRRKWLMIFKAIPLYLSFGFAPSFYFVSSFYSIYFLLLFCFTKKLLEIHTCLLNEVLKVPYLMEQDY